MRDVRISEVGSNELRSFSGPRSDLAASGPTVGVGRLPLKFTELMSLPKTSRFWHLVEGRPVCDTWQARMSVHCSDSLT